MKRLIALITTVVIAITVLADNRIYIQDAQTNAGTTLDVPIYLENSDNITAFQFDVALPEGLSLKESATSTTSNPEGGITLNTERTTSTAHELTYRNLGNGTYRVACYSSGLNNFSGTSGAVATLHLNVITAGKLQLTVSNIEMTQADLTKFTCNTSVAVIDVGLPNNRIYIEDAQGKDGQDITLPVYLENASPISAFQFDVTLPAGLTLKEVNSAGGITLNTGRTTTGSHSLAYHSLGNGVYRVLCYSADLKNFTGNSGAVADIHIAAPATKSTYQVTVSGIEMTQSDLMKFTSTSSVADITYVINSYKLFYVVDGDTVDTITLDYGTKITPKAEPTKTGYTFSGWSTIPATMPANDVTITGSFTVNKYSIIFDTEGGSAINATNSITQDYNTAVTAPANPTKTGYTFKGWDKAIPTIMPANNVTVKALWTVNQYTITFDTDGGTAINAITQDYNTAVTAPANPTKTGYTFNGWDSTIPTTMPANNMMVKALWQINKYTITYKVDGNVVSTEEVEYGTKIIPLAEPTQTGATFSGWSSIPETMPDHDVTITGSFGTNFYKLTYTIDGKIHNESNVAFGSAITPLAAPTKEGYTFSGWSEIPATMPAGDVTITGAFTVNKYTITFDTDGGSAISAITQDYNSAITAPANPTKTGYTFKGWDSTIPANMPANNVTVKAQWQINKYTITYKVGDVVYKTEEVEYGAKITPIAEPTQTGATFSGWSTIPDTMPDHDVTIEGSFGTNFYKLTYTVDGKIHNESNVAFGSAITPLAAPTKEGYTFSGWSEIPATMPAGDVTITGAFTVNKYTITFDTDGGSAISAITQDYNTAVTAPANPTKTGYTFKGWDSTIPANMPANNVTVKAQWQINKYTITYKVGDVVYKTEEVEYGAKITPIAEPTQTGATFSGWSTIPDTMPDHDVTIEGSFGTNFYKLTYTVDGKIHNENNVAFGATITPLAAPIKEGYTFSGWSEIPATMPAGDVTITGSFTVNQYTITFDTDGGSAISEITQDYNTTVKAPANPTKTGYTFKGWDKDIPATMPANNVTVKALWTVNQYTITFDTDGGTAISAIIQDYNSAITAPANPTKTGYTFKGWDKEIPTTMPANNMTVKAQWQINKYTITYKVDGNVVSTEEVEFGAKITPIAEPTQTGATFSGWSTIPETMPDHDVVITGSFGTNSYKLTYMVDGKVHNENNVAFGSAITPLAAPIKEGYTFSGWSEIPATMPAGDVTITGSFTVNQYTITFDTDGGSAISAITQDYNSAVKAPANPTKTGYTFKGWDKDIPTTMPANNMTVKAQWQINKYTITFDTDGGSTISAITQDYNSTITAPANPTKTGYTFKGWDNEIPTTMPANNVTVKALWTINQYTITFDTDGGSAISAITQDYNSAITAPANPTKTGYTFEGWDKEIPTTMPANNVMVKAQWQINKYTITYKVDDNIVSTEEVEYDAKITPKEEPTQNGYVFSGWSEIPQTMPAHDVTVTGTFTIDYVTPDDDGDVSVSNPDGTLGTRIRNWEDVKILHVDGHVNDEDIQTIKSLQNLLVLYWDCDEALPKSVWQESNNNLIAYVNDDTKIEGGYSNSVNTITNGKVRRLELMDSKPVLIPDAFDAEYALFIRNFDMETERMTSAGWSSIILPYSVSKTINEKGRLITPFADSDSQSDIHYWLSNCSGGFSSARGIEANLPYIIAMPNNAEYYDRYNVKGKVAFVGENVAVRPTAEAQPAEGTGFALVPAYESVESSESVYALNLETVYIDGNEYKPGSVFVSNSRDVSPFECYLVPRTYEARQRSHIAVTDLGESTGMTQISDNGFTITVRGSSIVITSPKKQHIGICNMMGANVREMEVHAGQTIVGELPSGIYLVNGYKVIVKQ